MPRSSRDLDRLVNSLDDICELAPPEAGVWHEGVEVRINLEGGVGIDFGNIDCNVSETKTVIATECDLDRIK
eukprot:CAMPEP_0172720496 /NCGR_PEP_ID=MMETSP1074-20121228/77023_1 /TAXON_ID=2916 /ORGANISM="Ceratium fusus, Strain PA161109" /LENGTH=71 /DNA_ID=CAMNT_0013546021 /DNA_START=272 /DNA_END=484 /DNA_ORIENTATION=-